MLSKLIKNLMDKVELKIVTTRKQQFKWSFTPKFKRENEYPDKAIAIKKEKSRTNVNKPIYIVTFILNFSKFLMHDSHYNYIKNRYGDKVEILLTDTDSLMHKIEVKNVYEHFYKERVIRHQ